MPTLQVWIDKRGGSHYHKENCWMVQDKRLPYEPTTKRLRPEMHLHADKGDITFYHSVIIDGQKYHMCPGCFGKPNKPHSLINAFQDTMKDKSLSDDRLGRMGLKRKPNEAQE